MCNAQATYGGTPANCYPALVPVLQALQEAAGFAYVTYDGSIRALQEYVDEQTACVILETFASWMYEVADVSTIAAMVHRAGAMLVVDNTAATPLWVKPIQLGADIVVHSLAKYLSNATDFGGVCIAGSGGAAQALARLNALGFLNEEFPEERAQRVLQEWLTLPQRMTDAQHSTLETLSFLSKRGDIKHIYSSRLHGKWVGFPSLITAEVRSRQSVLEGLRRPLPIEVGPGWGGAYCKAQFIPERYRNLRLEFAEGRLLRLYVAPGQDRSMRAALAALFPN